MIACILCGGVGEVMLVMAGFTWLLKWFRKRHDKRKCKCCQSHMSPVTLDDCRKKTLEELEYERGIDK